ncbi:MAG TPA: hypothetical protein PKL54_13240, partial [Candidatus Hydrogenedentes bacterium]|nr:hypothetical protein [Candidatus Hydrogenedentota bacterium]
AWILSREEEPDKRGVVHLVCAKNRHGDICSLDLTFDGCRQSFVVAGAGAPAKTAPSLASGFDMGDPPYEEDDDVF